MKEPAWPLPLDLKAGSNDQAGSFMLAHLQAGLVVTTTPEHAYWVMSPNKACRIKQRGVFANYNNNGLRS